MKTSLMARACAAVFLGLSNEEKKTLVEVARGNYKLDLECSAVAVAVLVHEAEIPTGRLYDVVNRLSTDMSTGPHDNHSDMVELPALVTAIVLRREIGIYSDDFASLEARIAREARHIIDVMTSKVLPPNTRLARTSRATFDSEVAAVERFLAPTDIPPPSTVEIFPESKVMSREQASSFLRVLHEYEASLDKQARRAEEQRDAATSTDVRYAAAARATNLRNMAGTVRTIRALFVEAAAELADENASLEMNHSEKIAHEEQLVNSGTGFSREFEWGVPSVHGLIPVIFDDQDALEVNIVIPSGYGVHPLYKSAGREIDDRIGALIMQLINKNPNAWRARIRIDVGTEPRSISTRLVQTPLATETTTRFPLTIPCPFCGSAEPVVKKEDEGALFAGDIVEHVCSKCGQSSSKRYEQQGCFYMRPGYVPSITKNGAP